MRNPLSETITAIPPSGIRKFFDIVSEMNDAISLGVGEPDFDTPWHIRDEGIYSLEKGRTFYNSNAGLKELREEICKYLKRRFALDYDPITETLITVGGSEAIDLAMRVMLDPGDEVLIPEPCYVSYVPCCILAGGKPHVIELQAKNEFRLTKEELLEHITEKTKILVLPFPNNPTGAIMSREDLKAIAEVVAEKDLFVLSDAIYAELTSGGNHVSKSDIDKLHPASPPYSMFWICSRIFSISALISTTYPAVSISLHLEPMVLASRLNSWIRKSSLRPTGPSWASMWSSWDR